MNAANTDVTEQSAIVGNKIKVLGVATPEEEVTGDESRAMWIWIYHGRARIRWDSDEKGKSRFELFFSDGHAI